MSLARDRSIPLAILVTSLVSAFNDDLLAPPMPECSRFVAAGGVIPICTPEFNRLPLHSDTTEHRSPARRGLLFRNRHVFSPHPQTPEVFHRLQNYFTV